MAPVTRAEGVLWLRPLLDIDRASLRAMLRAEGISWAEDSSNADLRFDRIRMRTALPGLTGLGLGPARLAATAAAMGRARAALEAATAELAARAARPQPFGDVTLDPGKWLQRRRNCACACCPARSPGSRAAAIARASPGSSRPMR